MGLSVITGGFWRGLCGCWERLMPTDDFRVSVIVSNYQGRGFLPKCLSHLMNQTYRNYEVILVDAGSTDGSPEYVKKRFAEIKLLTCPRIGLGEAINIGIDHATGDIIIFDLNTDEYVQPDWLEELVKQLERFDFKIITGPTRMIHGTNLIDEAGGYINFFGMSTKIGHGHDIDTYAFTDEPVGSVCTPAFHRSIFEKVGPIDEAYFIYGEDLEFCHRARLAGIETRCCPHARSSHHINGTMGNNVRRLQYFSKRAHMRYHMIYSHPVKVMINWLYMTVFLLPVSLLGAMTGCKTAHVFLDKLIGRAGAVLWNIKHVKRTLLTRRQFRYMSR